MSDDIFNISFDEIVKQSEEAENTEIERVLEINSYEKLYLLKPNENGDPSCELSDEEKLSLYHDVVFSGLRRYYVENLAVRDFTLEGSIPYQLEIFDKVVQDNSWGNFLCKVVLLLLDKYPEKREDIVNFRTDWTKVPMFTVERKTNSKPIYNDLFLNCNHTALHSCWLLQDKEMDCIQQKELLENYVLPKIIEEKQKDESQRRATIDIFLEAVNEYVKAGEKYD